MTCKQRLRTRTSNSPIRPVLPHCVLLWLLKSPFRLEGFSAGSYTGALLACGSQDSARASWEWTRWRRMTQLRYAVLSHLAPWECRIGFFQPSWGHLTASFCYITTGTPCALAP